MSIFYNFKSSKIYNEDVLEFLSKVDDNSVDLIIVDPPYKLEMPKKDIFDYEGSIASKKKIKLVREKWDEFSLDEYIDWSEKWLLESKRILCDTGSMFVFGSYHNIGLINYICQKIKFMIINDICWYKRNAVPNLACRRLTASYESILWLGKNKKYTFNYRTLKDGQFPNDKLKKPNKQMRNVWDIPTAGNENVGHPTQKPIEVYKRCILTGINTEKDNPTIIDFFAGSGTCAVASDILGYNSILVEKDEIYYDIIKKRLKKKNIIFEEIK
jgi:DNA modification methylase